MAFSIQLCSDFDFDYGANFVVEAAVSAGNDDYAEDGFDYLTELTIS
jgi:hypothetical protein